MNNVIVLTDYTGPPSKLLAGYAAVYRHATTRGAVRGLLDHVVGTHADGLAIVEQWDSADAYRSHTEAPGVRRVLASSGLPAASVRLLEVFGPSRQLTELARAS